MRVKTGNRIIAEHASPVCEFGCSFFFPDPEGRKTDTLVRYADRGYRFATSRIGLERIRKGEGLLLGLRTTLGRAVSPGT